MKRLVFLIFLMLTATFSTAAIAQGLMPGPMGACPPMGCQPAAPVCAPPVCPPPVCGPPVCGPMMPPSCGAPSCPGICSIGVMAGYQVNNDPGKVRFTTRDSANFGVTGTDLPFEFQGIWVGAAGRAPLSQGVSARIEARNLFPTGEKLEARNTVVVGPHIRRSFKAAYVWRVLDGSLGLNVSPNFSILGGARWDYFDLRLSSAAPPIPGFSNPSDEGDLTLSSIIPYIGFESSWSGCTSGLNLKVIGTPWISTEHIFGLTYSDPAGVVAVRDRSQGVSRRGLFIEGTVQAVRKCFNTGGIGAFLSIQALNSLAERDVTSTNITPLATSTEISQTFNVDHYRMSLVVGGLATMSFTSPL
jgi:hypothetical protein